MGVLPLFEGVWCWVITSCTNPFFFFLYSVTCCSNPFVTALAIRWWRWASASRVTWAIRCVCGSKRRCRRKMSSTCSSYSRPCPQNNRCFRDRNERQRRVRLPFDYYDNTILTDTKTKNGSVKNHQGIDFTTMISLQYDWWPFTIKSSRSVYCISSIFF